MLKLEKKSGQNQSIHCCIIRFELELTQRAVSTTQNIDHHKNEWTNGTKNRKQKTTIFVHLKCKSRTTCLTVGIHSIQVIRYANHHNFIDSPPENDNTPTEMFPNCFLLTRNLRDFILIICVCWAVCCSHSQPLVETGHWLGRKVLFCAHIFGQGRIQNWFDFIFISLNSGFAIHLCVHICRICFCCSRNSLMLLHIWRVGYGNRHVLCWLWDTVEDTKVELIDSCERMINAAEPTEKKTGYNFRECIRPRSETCFIYKIAAGIVRYYYSTIRK